MVLLAFVACAGWLVAVIAVVVARTPPRPPVGERTLELGPEPPAVANFLVHDFRVTADAVPATAIDLAARNVIDIEERGPGIFYVRSRAIGEEPLTPYERRVLDHLHGQARDGVVSVGAVVRLRDVDAKETTEYFIVGSAEANPIERKLSSESPVGKAIMGRKKGETVEVITPRGSKVKFKIMEIKAA